MWFYQDWYADRFRYVAKVGSMGSTMLMCWAFLLAGRFRPIEKLVGGLDKAYGVHHNLGAAAFCLILLHPLFLAMHRLPDWRSFLEYFWFSADWARNSGIITIIWFAGLLAAAFRKKLRYHVWKHIHQIFGVLLVIVVIHLILGQGEITSYPALGAWFLLWLSAAFFCFLYVTVLYHLLGPLHAYRIAELRQEGSVIEILMKPRKTTDHRLIHQAGQFVYVDFATNALRSETHPFSISSAPEAEHLRLSVKKLGDWTSGLPNLEPGVDALVWGPYGTFGDRLRSHPEWEAVLIAGGIGISPFLSIIEDPRFRAKSRAQTHLIYSTEGMEDAYYHSRLLEMAPKIEHFHYVHHDSNAKGFLTAEAVADYVGGLQAKLLLICGPPPMMRALREQFVCAKVPEEAVSFEDFSLL